MVANGLFRFRKSRSDFLARVLFQFVRRYRPKMWASGGAMIMMRVLKVVCGFGSRHDKPILMTG